MKMSFMVTVLRESILALLVGLVVMADPYLADDQVITWCIYDNTSCSGLTNLGAINFSAAADGFLYKSEDIFSSNTYLWDPCNDFNIGPNIAGAFQLSPGGTILGIGVHSLASCDAVNGTARFNMNTTDNSKFTFVRCICGSNTSFLFEDENPQYHFNFNLTSKICCPTAAETGDSTFSFETIALIVIGSVIFAYVLFGTLYQALMRKRRGGVPDKTCITWIPNLILDGFIYIFGRRRNYESLQ